MATHYNTLNQTEEVSLPNGDSHSTGLSGKLGNVVRRAVGQTKMEITTACNHVIEGAHTLVNMPWRSLLGMTLGITFVVVGNVGQLLAVNEWLGLFVNGGTPWITALTVTATSTTVFFTLAWIAWMFVKRPKFGFLNKKCIGLAFIAGFGNASNGVLIIGATPNTPEIVQAFLLSTIVIWTFFLMKVAVRDQRSYISPLVVISFLFSVAGVVVGSASQFQNESMTTNMKLWTLVFAAGMFMAALYNVFVFVFMNNFSLTMGRTLSGKRILSGSGLKLASAVSHTDLEGEALLTGKSVDVRVPKSVASEFENATTVKLTMLFMTGITQTIFMWLYVPLDAMPWFGTSPNISAAYHNLGLGYQCVFSSACPQNGLYGFLFCFFYVFNYFGSAYLNSYSAAVTSMVNQLGSPVAAIALLIIPKWNVSQPPMPINLGESIAAVVFLVVGTTLYTAWEEGTRKQALLEEAGSPTSPRPPVIPL